MRRLGSSLIAASLLLGSVDILAKPNQEINTPSSQANPLEHPSACESVRITLVNGRKIETDSYRHQGDHVEITKKGKVQTILDKDIKLTEVRQGSCPDIVVTLKTGERIEGYRRDHVITLKPGQSMEDYLRDLTSWDGVDLKTIYERVDARTEIRQKDRVLTIADSDIKTDRVRFKTPFAEKLKFAALIPLLPLLLILCITGGCKEL